MQSFVELLLDIFFEFEKLSPYITIICGDICTIIFWLILKIITMFLQILHCAALLFDFSYIKIVKMLIQILNQDSQNVLLHINNHISILHQFFLKMPYTLNPSITLIQNNEYPLSEIALFIKGWNLFFLSGFASFFLFIFLIWIIKEVRFDFLLLLLLMLKVFERFGLELTEYFKKDLTILEYLCCFYYYCFLLLLFVIMLFLFVYTFWKNDGKFHSIFSYYFYFWFIIGCIYIIFGRLLIYKNFDLIIFIFLIVLLITIIILFYIKYLRNLNYEVR